MLLYIIYGMLILVLVLVLYIKRSQSYWKRKGIDQIDPLFPFGNFKESFTHKKPFFNLYIEFYKEFKRRGLKFGGLYAFTRPVWAVLDQELIKNVLVKDYDFFSSHGTYVNETLEPLTGNLFNLEGVKWKMLRAKLTPTFTSGRIKMMFQTIASCTPELTNIMDMLGKAEEPIDIKEILSRFTVDIIGNCAFGIECNCMKNPNSDFNLFSKRIFERNRSVIMKRALSQILPKGLISLLGFKVMNQDVASFFMTMVKENAHYRETNDVFRKDFFHLLLQLKNQGKLTDDEFIGNSKNGNGESMLDINEIAAQCFIFFGAGFETSSTTMAFALYEIANNNEIQEKVRKEITEVIGRHGNSLTYESVMEMTYLEKIVSETLRKYPPAPIIPRKCTKPYKLEDSDIVIEKGTLVQIPVCAIHMDPEYYPDPEKFDPERFSEENKASRPGCTWLPFGDGPRQCIGMRFGLLQSKVGLATILKDFHLAVNSKTITPVVIDTRSLVTSAKGGIWLNVKRI